MNNTVYYTGSVGVLQVLWQKTPLLYVRVGAVQGCAGLCRAVQGCAGLCRAVQGGAGRLSNHCNIACLHRHHSPSQTCIILHPRLENGSYARTCHTLLHFVTLFNTFLGCQPLCRHYTTGWGDLFHTL